MRGESEGGGGYIAGVGGRMNVVVVVAPTYHRQRSTTVRSFARSFVASRGDGGRVVLRRVVGRGGWMAASGGRERKHQFFTLE